MNDLKKYIAEFIGTFVLVLFACGVAVFVGCNTPAGILATALAFGLVIVSMAYSIGHISGCHINPAVSLAMLIVKKLSVKDFVGYVVAQFLGAIAGAAILGLFAGSFDALGANQMQTYNLEVLPMHVGMIAEVILTFVFVFTILNVTRNNENKSVAGLVIGLTLTLVHLLGINLTGTSVNPARSFGPALLQGGEALKQYWMFLVFPLVGAALAAVCYKAFNDDQKLFD